MLMHDYLTGRGLRDRSRIIMTTPMPSPLPVSKAAGDALLARFAELGIECIVGVMPTRVDAAARTPPPLDRRRASTTTCCSRCRSTSRRRWCWSPDWPRAAGSRSTARRCKTRFPDVYAIGDVTSVGTPRAGTFAEGAGKVVAAQIIARARGGDVAPYQGDGHCYIEFGEQQIAEIYVNFLGGPEAVERLQGRHARGGRQQASLRLQPRRPLVRAVGARREAVDRDSTPPRTTTRGRR